MINTVKKSIEHFIWKLDPKNNQWKATENDIKAIKEIAEFTETQLTKEFNNNIILAKLYVIHYGELLKYYEGTVFDQIPQKEFHKELDKSFDRIVDEFIYKHQMIEASLLIPKEHRHKPPLELKRLGIEIRIPDKLDKEETIQNLTSIINMAITKYNKN
jgi:hypothetical protein